MGKSLIIKGADFSAVAVEKLDFYSGVLTKETAEITQSYDTIYALRWWLPINLAAGTYKITLSVEGYTTPNNESSYAYAVRIVDSDSARTGIDLLIETDSRNVGDGDFSVNNTISFVGAVSPYLYVNINIDDATNPYPKVTVAFEKQS